MTTTISPSLGHGPLTQQGVGASPGYDAVDIRRLLTGVATEGVLSSGSYAVTQRAAGANMSVDIAASTGDGARVQGDAVTAQGLYFVAPHSAVINETISTADGTNPRNDLVVLEVKDNQHDADGSNLAQVRVITGTPNASAAKTDALGSNGTPSLPSSAIALAVVNVPASDTSISDSQIDDRRPFAWLGGSVGKCSIATAESKTGTGAALLATPDRVRSVPVASGELLFVNYRALVKATSGSGSASLYVGGVELAIVTPNGAVAAPTSSFAIDDSHYRPMCTDPTSDTFWCDDSGTTSSDTTLVTTGQVWPGGPLCVEGLAAGTYDVDVRYRGNAPGETVTAKDRKLTVWTQAFG